MLVPLAAVPPAAVAETGPSVSAFDDFARSYLADHDLPGAAVAVTRRGRMIMSAGYGAGSDGAPITSRTPLPIASLSKSMTAALVLRLAERGTIGLDRPVTELLPEFRLADDRYRQITVRHLLGQASGMADSAAHQDDQASSLAEAVDDLSGNGLTAAPGTRHTYHNPNFHVLVRIAEATTGIGFDDLLRRELFRPAGMDQARSCPRTDTESCRTAPGFVTAFGRPVAVPEPGRFVGGSGGVQASADDLARWLALHQTGGVSAGGERVLTAASIATAQRPVVPGSRYAMGWMTRSAEASGGAPQVWHGGTLSTATAYQVLVPETGYGFAVIINQGSQLSSDRAWGLVDGLIALSEDRPAEPPAAPPLWPVLVPPLLAGAVVVLAALSLRRALRRTAGGRAGPILGWLAWAALGGLVISVPVLAGLLVERRGSWPTHLLLAPEATISVLVIGLAAGVVVAGRLVIGLIVRPGRSRRG